MRTLFGIAGLLVAAAVVWQLFGSLEPPAASASRSVSAEPRYYLKDARWRQLGPAGKTEYQVQADEMRVYDDESAQLEQLVINGLAGEDRWTLRAPTGYAPPHERRILLEGSVRGQGQWTDGERFAMQTPHLWLDTLRREIYTDARIELISQNRQLQADGFRADWGGAQLQLNSRVKVRYDTLD